MGRVVEGRQGSAARYGLLLHIHSWLAVDVQVGGFAHSLVACVISTRLATSRLISAGAMPERGCRLFLLLGFKPPVIKRQVLFNAGSSFLVGVDPSQTGHAYSAEE